jgi:hypothetical protein
MTSPERADRLAAYAAASSALEMIDDRRLGLLLTRAPLAASGVGGTAVSLQAGGVRVFAKRIPLTDLERRPENVRSTANLFALPAMCHWGVGGPGFGAWRELAANVMTTGWVIADRCAGFPLMYHWRVLPGWTPIPEEHADREHAVAYWHGSPAVRERLAALAGSSATLVLFLEHVPDNLRDWFAARIATGDDDTVSSACMMVERDLLDIMAFLHDNNLVHFDAHFGNVLTDGRRLYLADFGLAASPCFELSADEISLLRDTAGHDRSYAAMCLVNAVLAPLCDSWQERFALIRRYAHGAALDALPASVAAITARYAPVAAIMNDFYRRLHGESRTTAFPAGALRGLAPITRSNNSP